MKNILITGLNSYIGTSFEKWLRKYENQYTVNAIDTRNDIWRSEDFSKYDVVFHVAGIAHVSADPKLKELYYKVNRDLTIEVAQKAKNSGIKQFIFMSSIIVYGDSSRMDEKRAINIDTIPKPSNFYGESKLQAENGILKLQTQGFNVAVLRPPMIYGKGSKGNYPKLSKLAQKTIIFPNIENERSMLYIDNLCEFIRLIIDNNEYGIYYPQNNEYVSTAELVKTIALVHNKKIHMIKIFNPIIRIMSKKVKVINKVFGNLVYEKSMSQYGDNFNYCTLDFKKTIYNTEVDI